MGMRHYLLSKSGRRAAYVPVLNFNSLFVTFGLTVIDGELAVLRTRNPLYMSNEQKEIDKLVYEMYGSNKDDIREVETWYARRYPKLARFADVPKGKVLKEEACES